MEGDTDFGQTEPWRVVSGAGCRYTAKPAFWAQWSSILFMVSVLLLRIKQKRALTPHLGLQSLERQVMFARIGAGREEEFIGIFGM